MLNYFKLLFYLYFKKSIIIRRISKALGDNILLTMLIRPLAAKHPGVPIIVETPFPELFENNPFVTWVTPLHIATSKKMIKPKYRITKKGDASIREQMAAYIGEKTLPNPELFLSKDEVNWVEKVFPFQFIAIGPHGKAKHCANRKDWGASQFQEVILQFPEIKFVQVGTFSEPLLRNVMDARSDEKIIDLRKTAAILKQSMFFLGLEGGLMHLACAVGAKSVIVYGGHTEPSINGYDCNVPICRQPSCSPCFSSETPALPCETMICMRDISVDEVSDKLREVMTLCVAD